MTERPALDTAQLPTTRQLAIASVGAALVAAALLVVAVLPAEWGVDPTGAGRLVGLTQLGQMKQQVTEAPADGVYAERRDELSIVLQPDEGAEIKAIMRAGDAIDFSWVAEAPLFFEFHGDPKGKPGSEFVSYEKATKSTSEGHFEAKFEGKHGWFWRNGTSAPVTIELRTHGVYASVALQ